MRMAIIESIPNVSEGRRPEVVERARRGGARSARRPAARPLVRRRRTTARCSPWPATPAPIKAAILALFEQALAGDRSAHHQGEHPRLGAVDVVPFVPIEGVTMADCVALARDVAATVAERFALPVYLYEEAARHAARGATSKTSGAGEFEGLAREDGRSLAGQPDFGPAAPHPTAGATVIGARLPLIAYNINLQTDRLDVRQGGRRGRPPQQRRPALRQGDGASRSRSAASCRCR